MQTQSTPSSAAELAARHGLVRTGSRLPLGGYLAAAWRRRHFALTLATSRAYARNQISYLGELWAVLTPVLWAAVYLFVFGFLLDTSRGVENFIAFLVIGVFLFRFTSSGLLAGSGGVVRQQALITSLQFPRVLLPLAIVLAELLTLLPALVVLLILVPATGEPLTARWLLLPVAVGLLYLFVTGVSLILSRLVAQVRDVANLIPFVIRALMYVSGVFFSVEHYAGSGTLGSVLSYQPVAVYLSLARGCLLEDMTVSGTLWLWGVGWALGFLLVGLVWFWQGEERYGRG